MNSEDRKHGGEQEIDQIYQKIAGNFLTFKIPYR